MATRLAVDDKLIEEARQLGGHKTTTETVTAALSEYVARRKQSAIVALFGTVDYDSRFDYKRERRDRK